MATMVNNTFERTTFTQSRMMDFFTGKSLSTETGHDAWEWPVMAVKELIDNSLDACEQTTAPPAITITVESNSITVTDNGPGLPVESLGKIIDFSTRTSSNARIVSPTRGSQGNALKTILAASYVLSEDDEGFVHVDTQGQGFDITITTDPIRQEPVISLVESEPIVKTGTSVNAKFPCVEESQNDEFLQIVRDYAFLNPHTTFTLRMGEEEELFQATIPDWQKWLTSWPTSATWYSSQDFASLVAAHIAHDGGEMTVRQFVSTFDGCSGSAKQKKILDATDLSHLRISDFVVEGELDSNRIEGLLKSLKANSRDVNPKKLGVIGEDHLRERFVAHGGDSEQFKYKCLRGVEDGLPYVIEAAFAFMPVWEEYQCAGEILAGVNWAASLSRLPLQLGSRSLDRILEDCHCDTSEPIFLMLHLATPAPGLVNWLGKGKNIANLSGEVADKITSAIRSVTRDWKKLRDAEDRQARQTDRRVEKLLNKSRPKGTSLKDAIFIELPKALDQVSEGGEYPFQDRDFYYATRPLVQKHTTAKLTQKYFDKIVGEWERMHGVIELKHRYPRGYFIEPHTGNTIPLGTAEVKAYALPEWQLHTILVVEKKGYGPLFQKVQLAERYDMGIVLSEGYAVDACKMLLADAQQGQEITILCLHDADPYGKNIARSLRKATLRSKAIKVVDIGMSLDDAIDMGLSLEYFERKKALPKGLELTETEMEHFTGQIVRYTENNRPVYGCQRVELNALSAEPMRFVAYVEQQLEKHGCKNKLVPPDGVVNGFAEEELDEQIRNAVTHELKRKLEIGPMTGRLAKEMLGHTDAIGMARKLARWKKKLSAESWKRAIKKEIESRVKGISSEITEAVIREIKK